MRVQHAYLPLELSIFLKVSIGLAFLFSYLAIQALPMRQNGFHPYSGILIYGIFGVITLLVQGGKHTANLG